jgi:hypothetical protein
MKPILLFALSIFFVSCTQYQYLTVSSEQMHKNEKNDFVAENDTLRITYRFNGYSAPVHISIFNKKNQPLEVNWKKSAVIINEQAVGYYSPNLYLNGTARIDTGGMLSGRYMATNVSADILVNEPSQFVPPQSSISKVPVRLPLTFLKKIPIHRQPYKSLYVNENYRVEYKRLEFTQKSTPVAFRSYLYFNYEGTDFTLEHLFYVSDLWQTGSSPKNLPGNMSTKGDMFHL